MPLDPKLLAALSAKTSSYDPTKVNWGDATKTQGSWNLGQSIIDILSTGGYASAGIAKKIGENVSSIGKGDFGAVADLLNPASAVGAGVKGVTERQTYAPLLENIGVDKNVAPWLGLALDIGLDPTTYITGGTIAGVKGIGAGAKLASTANKVGGTVLKKGLRDLPAAELDQLSAIEKAIEPSATALTGSQKLGNYLTGVLRGYEFNKSAYSVKQLDRKLGKQAAKEAKKSGDFELADEILRPVVRNVEDAADPKVAYAGVLTRRDALLGLIQNNPKLAPKLEKLAEKASKAGDLAFSTSKKVDDVVAPKVGAAAAAELTAKTIDDGALEQAIKQDRLDAARLRGLNRKIDELDRAARQIENPAAQGGTFNYETGLRPQISYSADPKDVRNLIPAVREVDGKYRPAIGSSLLPDKAPAVLGAKTYETSEEALTAARAHVERRMTKAGVAAEGSKLETLAAQVDDRISELEDYTFGARLDELGINPESLSIDVVNNIIRSDEASDVAKALDVIEVAIPAKRFTELARAINVVNSQFGARVTQDELAQWAESVNEYLTTKPIPGFPVKAGDVVPEDFWAFGDLLYANRDGSIVVNREIDLGPLKKQTDEEEKLLRSTSVLIEKERKKAKSTPDFYERLGSKAAAFKKAEATYLDIETGALKGSSAKALETMKKIAPLYEYGVKTLPNGKTIVTKTLTLEPANVAPVFKQTALGIPSAKSLLQGAPARTVTLGQLGRAVDSTDPVIREQARELFDVAKADIVEAASKPVRTWEQMFADKEGVDFLLSRVLPTDADTETFAMSKKFINDLLNETDQIPSPDDLRAAFQEFLSGRNPLAALRDGKLDLGVYTEPTSTKYKGIRELVMSLTGESPVELSVDATNKIASILKINPDPTATRSQLVLRATTALFTQRDKLEEAQFALRKMYESGGVNANVADTLATVGITDQASVNAVIEEAINVPEELVTIQDEVFAELENPELSTIPTDYIENARGLKEHYAKDLLAVSDELEALDITSPLSKVVPMVLRAFGKTALTKLAARAEKKGISLEEYLSKGLTGELDDFVLDPSVELTPDAVRLDMLNTEARQDFFTQAWSEARKRKDKNIFVAEEALSLRGAEAVFRAMGIPVKVQENYGMRSLRAGVAVGDKIPEEFYPLTSFVTYADIASAATRLGAEELFTTLRFPKTGQNVMPSQIEYGWLAAKQVTENGVKPTPGSPEWEKIKESINTKFDLKTKKMVPADHVTGGKRPNGQRVPANKAVNAAIDDLVGFMVENLDLFKAMDATRAGISAAQDTAQVMTEARKVYVEILKFVALRSKFMDALPDLGKFNAIEKGMDKIPGTEKLLSAFIDFSSALKVGQFENKELAARMADTITNMFLFTSKGNNGLSKAAAAEIRTIFPTIKAKAREFLMVSEAGPVKAPKDVLTPKQTKAKKNARRQQAAEHMAETENMVDGAITNMDARIADEAAQADAAAAQGQKLPDDKSTISSNMVSGHEDPVVGKLEKAAESMMKAGSLTSFGDNFMTKFSGVYGMGKEVKTMIGGIEHLNISSVQMFGDGLKKLAGKYGRDIPAINNAFRFLQKWGKESYEAIEADELAPAFDDWLKSQNTAGVNMDIVNDLKTFTDSLFGDNGSMTGAIHREIFAKELDRGFGAQGLANLGDGTGFILPKGSGPDAIRWSWSNSTVADDGKFNSLETLFRYAAALHAASTRVGIADTFTHFFGRTAQQIANEGLDATQFFKVDPAEGGFAELLDPNVFYSKAEWDKLAALKSYIDYDRTFKGSLKKVVDLSDRITRFLKASHTTWRLGHHVTSIVGETIMNLMDGVVSTAYYSNGARILNKYRAGQYSDDANIFKAYEELNMAKGMQLRADKFDAVGYVNRAGKRVLLSDEAVHALAERYAVLTKPGSSLEDFIAAETPTFGKKLTSPISSVNDKLAEFSSARDNFFRMAHFIKELEKGGTFASAEEAALHAARRVHEYHPTVASLSAFEKKYARRVVFFYTWQRLAATKVFSLMVEQPGIVTIPSKIQYAFAEYNGFNPESFGDPWDPNGIYASYNTGSLYGPQFQGPAGTQDAWGFAPAVPQLDILNSLFQGYTIQPGQSALDVMTSGSQQLFGRNLSPLPKWFVEITSGEQVGSGGPITSFSEYAIDQVGGLNTLSKLTGIGREPDANKTPQEIDETKLRQIINWLSGQKLTDYSTTSSEKKWRSDQAQIIANENK